MNLSRRYTIYNKWVFNKLINDEEYKNFYKNRNKDIKVFKNKLSEFSSFLEELIKE